MLDRYIKQSPMAGNTGLGGGIEPGGEGVILPCRRAVSLETQSTAPTTLFGRTGRNRPS